MVLLRLPDARRRLSLPCAGAHVPFTTHLVGYFADPAAGVSPSKDDDLIPPLEHCIRTRCADEHAFISSVRQPALCPSARMRPFSPVNGVLLSSPCLPNPCPTLPQIPQLAWRVSAMERARYTILDTSAQRYTCESLCPYAQRVTFSPCDG